VSLAHVPVLAARVGHQPDQIPQQAEISSTNPRTDDDTYWCQQHRRPNRDLLTIQRPGKNMIDH
jgi:hypothetical protein